MNLFQRYHEDGSIKDLGDLKRVFRALAKRIHPDVVGDEVANARFVRLRDDFNEYAETMRAGLPPERASGPAYTRKDVIEQFMDLEATGFLLPRSKAKRSRLYIERLNLCSDMIASYGIPGVSDLGKVEAEIGELRSLDRQRFAILKLLIESVLSYHYEPRAFVKASIRRLYEDYRAKGPEPRGGKTETDRFIDWLVEDAEQGSVYGCGGRR